MSRIRWIDIGLKPVALTAAAFLTGLLCLEGLIRAGAYTDLDGNEYFRSVRLKPYRLPVEKTRRLLADFLETRAPVRFDPLLGWSPRPGSASPDGKYAYDSHGIRRETPEDVRSASSGTLVLAVFGDSYAHGYEVPFKDTFGARMEKSGAAVQVLNLGYPGYGMDQAYLRWRYFQLPRRVDIVVLGFQAENLRRSHNILRPLYSIWSRTPLSKPRFVLTDKDLRLINSPTIPAAEVPQAIANIRTSGWAKYEGAFFASDYEDHLWLKSRAVSLIWTALTRRRRVVQHHFDPSAAAQRRFFNPKGDSGQLALRLIERFRQDAVLRGADFWILHMPREGDLRSIRSGAGPVYQELLSALKFRFKVVDPSDLLLSAAETCTIPGLYAPQGHYSAAGHEVLANALLGRLRAWKPTKGGHQASSRSPRPPTITVVPKARRRDR